MIVAVSHFNMGAMENKGLNIFNTACVLAHPSTTTDAGFQRVESVVAHEYFHNWSGNRVTCRDWFQLSLKEGFTVFRDQQFSADMNSAAVQRVENVDFLVNHQFPEDQGPMAHPVRPAEYQKIDNFYTLTIYEKGAEIVRMQYHLLGSEDFRRATDLYFERFRPRPLKSFKQSDRVLMCGSFSKSLSPSLRIGYVAGGKYAAQVLSKKRILSGSTNPITQVAVAHYLEKGSFERHLRTLRQQFETQVRAMRNLVIKHFPQGTRISEPKGGFVLWVELPSKVDTARLFNTAIAVNVAYMPGSIFSASGLYKNCLRLNCGHPVNEDTAVAIAKLGQLFA